MADRIARLETFCVRIPYRGELQFASDADTHGPYVLLRITTRDGIEGIAEATARPSQFQGEDIGSIAYQLGTYFKPLLIGKDPLAQDRLFAEINRIKFCRAAKQMIDVALWDIKAKSLGLPLWRLLGGGEPKPVPISTIVFGDTVKAMARDAAQAVEKHGVKGFKIKVWKRSEEDVATVRDIRKAVGPGIFLYADANSVYAEGEARRIFPRFAEHDIQFIEDPCAFVGAAQYARLARDLPIPILGDLQCESLRNIYALLKADAIGAVSVKLRRNGLTEAMKIIGMCEAAAIPVVIGTDTETRIGALARVHLWAAFRSIQGVPAETGFFRHLADDCFKGSFVYKDGAITVPTAPGIGAAIDEKKARKYAA